jgi:hypothetical protein
VESLELEPIRCRGRLVTFAQWVEGGRFTIRAEVRQRMRLVCVLSSFGAIDRAKRMMARMRAQAVRLAEDDATREATDARAG